MDTPTLVKNNIKTVITAASGLYLTPENNYVNHYYPMSDIETYNISKHFDDCIRQIEVGLKRGSVLVHCFMGISRSTTIVLAYLMK